VTPARLPDGAVEPAGLVDAFWDYERALMSNDLEALDRLFAPGGDTVRGDAGGLIVGHAEISAFRRGRGGSPRRRILAVELRPLGEDDALVIAVTAPLTGGRGQQTQLWHRGSAGWTVTAAHVSLPPPALSPAVWRVAGTPLVPGRVGGPLAGHTVAVKDLFEVEGFPVGAGVPAYLAQSPLASSHASAVSALLDAGADIAGIAQTDEFAYSIAGRNPHYGTPPNPAVVGGIPGGSSNGPASAVALGQASIGLGTDTGGSIRVPASYQGLWGLRTTHGAVDASGLVPLAPSFDTIGWLTRDAPALRGAAMASLDAARQSRAAEGYLVMSTLLDVVEPDVRAAFERAVDVLESAGRGVDTLDRGDVGPGDVDHWYETFRTVQAAEAWRVHGAWIREHPDALGDDIRSRFAWAATISADREAAARRDLVAARSRIESALGDRVLVLPSASSVAPSATADQSTIERTRAGTLRLTCIAGITGRPALGIPALEVPQPGAVTPAPAGLCLVGPRFTDLALIDDAETMTTLKQ